MYVIHECLNIFFSYNINIYFFIVLVAKELDLERCCEKGTFLAIDTSNIPNLVVNHAAIYIPLDLLHSLSNDNESIRVASSFYKNISQIISFSLQEK